MNENKYGLNSKGVSELGGFKDRFSVDLADAGIVREH